VQRFVPAKLHGILDFLTVGLYIAGSDVFRAKDAPASTLPSQVMGPSIAFYSMLTDYGSDNGFGSLRVLSMKRHLQLDAAFALAIGLSPWVFGTWRKGWQYWAPQTFAMSSELFFALTTELEPE
jgi:hypothetical protein